MSLAHPSRYLNPLASFPAGMAARTLGLSPADLLDAVECGELEELTPERISVASMAAYALAQGDRRLSDHLSTTCRVMASPSYLDDAS